MTTLVSAIYGGYDVPKPLPDGHGFDDAVLVTDTEVDVPGWRVVVEPSTLPPRLAAKHPKMLPWRYTDDETSLWLDGSFEVLPGLRAVVDEHLESADLVAWRHPHRVDLFEEADFSAGYVKYAGIRQALARQAREYAHVVPRGPMPGLFECGMLARRHTGPVRSHGTVWLSECVAHTEQDQVSFPFACWRTGVLPGEWKAVDHWRCGWVRWVPHTRE